jgi:tetratricopeptide (TPR) repeat protein
MDRDNDTAREAIAEAWSSVARRDFSTAVQQWRRIIERFPDNPSGYAGAGAALRDSGGLDEAEELLAQAFLRFPSSSEVATNYGWTAHARRDWEEAVRRWELVRVRYPDSPSGYAGGGAALRELGRFDEAEAVLRAGLERLPSSADIAVTHAAIAGFRRNWPEAAKRWEDVRARFPTSTSAYLGGAAALRALGRNEEAESVLAEGVELCPGQAEVAVEYARLAHQHEDWAEAMRRWELVRERFPGNTAAQRGAEEARQRMQRIARERGGDSHGRGLAYDPAKSASQRRGQHSMPQGRPDANARV